VGQASQEIVQVAQEEGADLIVMGTHGLTGWRHLVLGSVAETVVRTATCPVLTIRAQCNGASFSTQQPRKILCPTDFSEPSYTALDAACGVAEEFESELVLFHAIEWAGEHQGVFLPQAMRRLDGEIRTETLQRLTEIINARVPDAVKVTPRVQIGNAALGITATATEAAADLIVMATHGITGWRHLVLGSVAETVVRTAPCPVLTVPIPRGTVVSTGNGGRSAKESLSVG
jgi:nucleotide-binding universal stress UspA family protein